MIIKVSFKNLVSSSYVTAGMLIPPRSAPVNL
jgi:hypothetical protein